MFNIFKKENKITRDPETYIFIGRSGSGKGTQAELLINYIKEKNKSKILHIETGAFFREFIKKSLYTEVLAKKVVESGGLMPEAMAIHMWVDYLVANFTGNEDLIFDGAPRKLMEAELLDGVLAFYGIKKYKVIHINTSVKWCTDKLLARGRKDDTKEGIASRMHWYDTEVMQSIKFFENNANSDFIDVNGEQTIEEVHKELMQKLFGK